MHHDDEGDFGKSGGKGAVHKTYTRRRLACITTAREGVSPVGAFLGGVDAFLIGEGGGR